MGLTQLAESDTLEIHAESCTILWNFTHLHTPPSGNIEYPTPQWKLSVDPPVEIMYDDSIA